VSRSPAWIEIFPITLLQTKLRPGDVFNPQSVEDFYKDNKSLLPTHAEPLLAGFRQPLGQHLAQVYYSSVHISVDI
jgi:hypothetical protein